MGMSCLDWWGKCYYKIRMAQSLSFTSKGVFKYSMLYYR